MSRAGWLAAGFVIGASVLGGCAGTKGPVFQPEVVDPAKAVIYVYREPRSWAGRPVEVSIDQKFLGRLDAGQYLAETVDPGQRVVRVAGSSDAVRLVRLVPGDSAFLEVQSSYWNERPTIELIDEATARSAISHTGRADAAR